MIINFSWFFMIFKKRPGISIVPGNFRKPHGNHVKVHQKWWGGISRILYLVNMWLRYGRSKGVWEYKLEEHPLGNMVVPCHMEENASHYIHIPEYLKIFQAHSNETSHGHHTVIIANDTEKKLIKRHDHLNKYNTFRNYVWNLAHGAHAVDDPVHFRV